MFFVDERTGRLLFADGDGECGEDLIKRGYLYDKATKRYEKHFKGGNITTITFTKK